MIPGQAPGPETIVLDVGFEINTLGNRYYTVKKRTSMYSIDYYALLHQAMDLHIVRTVRGKLFHNVVIPRPGYDNIYPTEETATRA